MYTRFNRSGGGGVEVHERVIAIEDDGLNVHGFGCTFEQVFQD